MHQGRCHNFKGSVLSTVSAAVMAGVSALLPSGIARGQAPEQIVVVGDSISGGATEPGAESWPAIVEAISTEGGMPIGVVNLSMDGASAFEWARDPVISLNEAQRQISGSYGLIALGEGDAYSDRSWSEFVTDLMAIALKLNRAGSAKIILLQMPVENGSTPAQEALRLEYNWIQQTLCDDTSTPFEFVCIDASEIPLAGNFPVSAGGGYGAYPTAQGQLWLGGFVHTALSAW